MNSCINFVLIGAWLHLSCLCAAPTIPNKKLIWGHTIKGLFRIQYRKTCSSQGIHHDSYAPGVQRSYSQGHKSLCNEPAGKNGRHCTQAAILYCWGTAILCTIIVPLKLGCYKEHAGIVLLLPEVSPANKLTLCVSVCTRLKNQDLATLWQVHTINHWSNLKCTFHVA